MSAWDSDGTARVYDVVDTSVGSAHRESEDNQSSRCPAGTTGLLHQGTAQPPDRQQEHNQ